MGTMPRVLSLLISMLSLLFPRRHTSQLVYEASVVSVGRLALPSSLQRTSNTVLLPYRHPLVRALIIEAKFHHNTRAIGVLGVILSDYVASFMEDTLLMQGAKLVLVPIPLGENRKKRRGYNQVEEIILATKLPTDVHLLKRTRETKPQTSLLRKERFTNVIGAFALVGTVQKDTIYIVVDDVSTTGTTLEEACDTLHRAGAQQVYGVALAH